MGKAYLYLSRVYQCLQTPEYYQRAQQTLKHAYDICVSCAVSLCFTFSFSPFPLLLKRHRIDPPCLAHNMIY